MNKIIVSLFFLSTLFQVKLLAENQEQWSNFVKKDRLLWSRKVSTQDFHRDREMGIEFFTDPQKIRQLGSRQFHIWHNGSSENNWYLRVAGSHALLEERPFVFDTPAIGPAWGLYDDLRREAGVESVVPFFIDEISETHSYDSWDFAYQKMIENRGGYGGYLGIACSLFRQQLLKDRYNIEANFVHAPTGSPILENSNLEMFVVKADTVKGGVLNESVGFVFDSDPFGFAYRIPIRDRIAAHLSSNNQSFYQWVRVSGDGVTYGDIHEFSLPRPVNIGVIGDSYTSGEAAPFSENSANAFGIDPWITEYADYEDSKTHRSLASGWEKAVCQQNRMNFGTVSLNFYNVSQSGAQVRVFDEFAPQNERWTGPKDFVIGNMANVDLNTASAQLWVLEALLSRDSQQNCDVLGFTFGGNDAYFSSIIGAMLLLDYERGDYDLMNIGEGGEDDNEYPIGIDDPFDGRYPSVTDFGQMMSVASENLQEVLGGFKLRFGVTGAPGPLLGVRKTIRGNYCNPIGSATNYQPEGVFGDIFSAATDGCYDATQVEDPGFWGTVWNYTGGVITGSVICTGAAVAGTATGLVQLGWGGLLELDSSEMDLIRDEIMPGMNDLVVGADVERNLGYQILADTREPTIESSGLGTNHSHFMTAEDNWFSPVTTLDEDQSTFPYAFHPNVRGHDRIYRPVYNEKLAEVLNPAFRREIYEEEMFGGDLVAVSTYLFYQENILKLGVVARNDGVEKSAPSLINLGVTFGPEREVEIAPAITRVERSFFKEPLIDTEDRLIVIKSLNPREIFTAEFDLVKGEQECAYYDLIIEHFLRLQDQELIRDLIGSNSPETLAARLAAFIPLFGNSVAFGFELSPVSGVPELNMSNNFNGTYYDFPFEPDFSTLFEWANKTRENYFKGLFERMLGLGFNPEKLSGISNEDFYNNRKLLEQAFEISSLALTTFDRDALISDEVIESRLFVETSNRVEDAMRTGPLNPKPIYFDNNIFNDSLTVITPQGSKQIAFDDWSRLELLLPRDGGVLTAIYNKAEKSKKPGSKPKFTTIPIRIKTAKNNHGLKDFYKNNLITEGMLRLDIDFAERGEKIAYRDLVRVRVTDNITEGVFFDYLHKLQNPALNVDLSLFLFHSDKATIQVDTLDANDTTRYSIYHQNTSQISQKDLKRVGAFVEFELTLRGGFASEISDEIEVSVVKQMLAGRQTNRLFSKLKVFDVVEGND